MGLSLQPHIALTDARLRRSCLTNKWCTGKQQPKVVALLYSENIILPGRFVQVQTF